MVTLQVDPTEFNQLSLAERDRRWGRIREEMSKRGVDCLLITGSSGRWNEMHCNIRYVCNYAQPSAALTCVLFPLKGEGTIMPGALRRSGQAMCWLKDHRGGSPSGMPDVIAERLGELGLSRGTIGLVGTIFFEDQNLGMPWNLYETLRTKYPNLKLVDVTDMFFQLRSVKSDEEIACLEKSAGVVDAGFEAHVNLLREGITEREYYTGIVRAMDAAGAEPPTFLVLASGPLGLQPLSGDPLPSNRVLRRGDAICSETSPKWAGYQAQGLECLVLGKPTREIRELAKYAAEIYLKCADQLRPGNTLDHVVHAADDVIERARRSLGNLVEGMRPICLAAGLGGPDPTPIPDELQPNQAFMLEVGPREGHVNRPQTQRQHIYGGYCIVTTNGAPHHLGKHSIEEMLLTVVD